MLLSEAYDRIVFKVGTTDDTSGAAVNAIVTNEAIINELMDQMRSYSRLTKGIHAIYSFSVSNTQTAFATAPSLAIRSEPYLYAFIISQATIYPCDIKGARDVYPVYRYNPAQGITSWIMPWHDGFRGYLSFFPMKNLAAYTTTLNGAISTTTATTITVTSTTNFIANHGRITIDSEKILYSYKDSAHFYGCVRGVEDTTAATHTDTTTVTENNVVLLYSKLPREITVESNDSISPAELAKELEICEEHMEGVVKATVYNLLVKIDAERAMIYKVDSQELYEEYADDIRKGYARKFGTNIRNPNETILGNLLY